YARPAHAQTGPRVHKLLLRHSASRYSACAKAGNPDTLIGDLFAYVPPAVGPRWIKLEET
ncbi:MAG: hypothetical protein ACXWO3_08255, partial [Isosphaeraceae bacterium]